MGRKLGINNHDIKLENIPGDDRLQQRHLGVVRPDEDGAGYGGGQRLGAGNRSNFVCDPVDGFRGETAWIQLVEKCVT